MGELEPISVVVTSVGTEQQAVEISEELVARRLATCVNIVPCLRSIYRWKGKVCEDSEYLLLIKTRRALFGAVQRGDPRAPLVRTARSAGVSGGRGGAQLPPWVVEMATGVPDAETELESEPSFD